MGTALEDFCRAQFGIGDLLRQAQGNAVGALGLDPDECPYRVPHSGPCWRLRDYGEQGSPPPLLIIAAPIKRPYIWDLAPARSAIRRCLQDGFHLHLLEWLPASPRTGNTGLDECVHAIEHCVAEITQAGGAKPVLLGHSLGGTMATIYCACSPESVGGLVLLSAPVSFQPQESRFRDALVSLVPSDIPETEPFPGSLLSHMSALASPGTFVWSRLMDAARCVGDREAMDIHARVERWALDEVPLPGKLVHQIIDWLYRENRLCGRMLRVNGTLIDPSSLMVPTLAIVNTDDEVAPLVSVKPFADARPAGTMRIIEYPGETGVALQHLAILVGREAHARVWPQIFAWIKSLTEEPRRRAPGGRVRAATGAR